MFIGPITVSAMPDMFRITSVGKDLDGGFSKIMQADKNGIGDVSQSSFCVLMISIYNESIHVPARH